MSSHRRFKLCFESSILIGILLLNTACSPDNANTPTTPVAPKSTWIKGVADAPYEVEGKTTQDVSNDIFNPKQGKGFGKGKKHAGELECILKYGASYHSQINKKTSEGCSCTATIKKPIEVTIEKLTVKFPKWKGYEKTTPACKKKWNNFMKALKVHEEGHLNICRQEKQRILKELNKLKNPSTSKSAVNCKKACKKAVDTIYGELDKAFQNEMKKSGKKHDDYDKKTHHGKTQGAVLKGC